MPVSTGSSPGLPTAQAHRGWGSYVSPGLLRVLTGTLVIAGLVAAVHGVVWDLYFAAGARHEPVAVSVRIRDLDRLRILQATSPGSRTILPFRLQHGPQAPGLQLYIDGVNQWQTWVRPGPRPFILQSVPSTAAAQAASYGGSAIVGLCMGWGALLVRSLLLSIGRGQPFHRRNATRIAGIAALIVAATLAAALLPYLAARLVLDRLGLGGPASPLYAHLAIPAAPLWLALFLLALAQAFRRGTQLAQDAEGLI